MHGCERQSTWPFHSISEVRQLTHYLSKEGIGIANLKNINSLMTCPERFR